MAYAEFLSAFADAMTASAIAWSADVQLPPGDPRIGKSVRKAWDAGDRFIGAQERMDLVASRGARHAAVPLSDMVQRLRDLPPLSDMTSVIKGPNPPWMTDVPSINAEAISRRREFVRAAVRDIGGDELTERAPEHA